jgi:predicted nuclease with TOPRIM domain
MTTGLDRYREQRRNDMHANVTHALKELDAQGHAGPTRAAASDASLRGQLHALRERLKEVKAENQRLRAELERALGLVRDDRHS